MRIRLDLAYDGTGFAGWAIQPGLRTVQGELEDGLARVLRLPAVSTVVAGRTDAGVHARGQVVHVDIPDGTLERTLGRSRETAEDALRARLRGVLRPDLVVTGVSRAPDGFHARFAALRRCYAYRLGDGAAGVPPLLRHEVVRVQRRLDVLAMSAAGAGLLGTRDFAAFCRRREGATTVRGLLRLDAERCEDGLVVIRAEADAFCHSMVRALVGALISVGTGRRDPDFPARVLRGGVRHPGVTVAPAKGLVLELVEYPPPELLAVRVAESRTRRDEGGGAWQGREMSEDSAETPVAAEHQDHDGVLEMQDAQDDRVADAALDQGYSPDEREHHVGRVGLLASEQASGESLDDRLLQEVPDGSADAGTSAGSPEMPADADDDGELLDDQVGGERAGRLVDPDQGGGPDEEATVVAFDVGVDGGAASAEEAAVHVVDEGR